MSTYCRAVSAGSHYDVLSLSKLYPDPTTNLPYLNSIADKQNKQGKFDKIFLSASTT